jgi:hypothetical protein
MEGLQEAAMTRLVRWPVALTALLFAGASAFAVSVRAGGKDPALPRDFRSWTHVKSMVVTDPDHGMYGFHNVYANKAALKAYRAKAPKPQFEDGAQIVVSIYEVTSSGGMVNAGGKRRDVLKVKDRSATATGGWRFMAFDPKGKPIAIDPVNDCYGCHAQASDTVYSGYTE